MKTPVKATPIQLFIHTPTDEVVTFSHVTPEATVLELKSQLELKTGILVELQSLYLSNIKLEDSKTLNEKQIKNGTVLRVKVKERSLEQIYITSAKGDIESVFKLGVEFMHSDDNSVNEADNDVIKNHLSAWNTFVPLRAFQALFSACCAGHIPLINTLLTKASANICMLSRNKRSVLHVAAYHGHLACVSFLLSKCADSKSVDVEGMSPMTLAAQNGHIKVEKRLWLFNWNMDEINKMVNGKSQQKIREVEREQHEVQQAAKQYRAQFENSQKENQPKNNNSLPSIWKKKEINKFKEPTANQNTNGVKLPKLNSNTDDLSFLKPQRITKYENMSNASFYSNHHLATSKQQLHKRSLSDEPRSSTNTPTISSRNKNTSRLQMIIPSPPPMLPYGTPQFLRTIELKIRHSDNDIDKRGVDRVTNVNDVSLNFHDENFPPKPSTIQLDSIDLKDKEGPKLKEIIPTNRRSIKCQKTDDIKKTKNTSSNSIESSHLNSPVIQDADKTAKESQSKASIKVVITKLNHWEGNGSHEQHRINQFCTTDDNSGIGNDIDDAFWKPEKSIPNLIHNMHTFEKSGKTFDEWLEEKQQLKKQQYKQPQQHLQQQQPTLKFSPVSQIDDVYIETDKDAEKKKQNKEAFEKWLIAKAKKKQFNSSKENDSSDEDDDDTKRYEKRVTFEKWLESKRYLQRSASVELSIRQQNPIRRQIRNGISFQEWKASKLEERRRKLQQIAQNYENSYNNLTNKTTNGESKNTTKIAYAKWLQKKNEGRKINLALKATIKAQEEQEESMKKKYRMLNPRLKTFEEWLLEKQYHFKSVNKSSDQKRQRYPEDSKIIFDMWLAQKFSSEMAVERERLNGIKGENGLYSKNEKIYSSVESVIVHKNVYSSPSEDDYESTVSEEKDEISHIEKGNTPYDKNEDKYKSTGSVAEKENVSSNDSDDDSENSKFDIIEKLNHEEEEQNMSDKNDGKPDDSISIAEEKEHVSSSSSDGDSEDSQSDTIEKLSDGVYESRISDKNDEKEEEEEEEEENDKNDKKEEEEEEETVSSSSSNDESENLVSEGTKKINEEVIEENTKKDKNQEKNNLIDNVTEKEDVSSSDGDSESEEIDKDSATPLQNKNEGEKIDSVDRIKDKESDSSSVSDEDSESTVLEETENSKGERKEERIENKDIDPLESFVENLNASNSDSQSDITESEETNKLKEEPNEEEKTQIGEDNSNDNVGEKENVRSSDSEDDNKSILSEENNDKLNEYEEGAGELNVKNEDENNSVPSVTEKENVSSNFSDDDIESDELEETAEIKPNEAKLSDINYDEENYDNEEAGYSDTYDEVEKEIRVKNDDNSSSVGNVSEKENISSSLELNDENENFSNALSEDIESTEDETTD